MAWERPNIIAESIDKNGEALDILVADMEIKPRPASISLANQDTYPMDIKAPAHPQNTPEIRKEIVWILLTEIPTDSAA